ncbi:MAG: GNAT family N-acetyltransferase [Candidatus Roseilinea sp.]|uniref:GNAT family N-acetyltransferase n=1 Tax=Candidatus Roseilinea sp. TaxID=2838777 RepID=UPI00404937CD
MAFPQPCDTSSRCSLIPEAPGVARIARMSVDWECQHSGIGRRILKTLLDHAPCQGYRRIVLETTDAWDDAIAFYLPCGFHITGRCDGDVHFALDL